LSGILGHFGDFSKDVARMAPSQAGKQVVQRQPTVTTRLFLIAFTTAFVGQFAGAAPNLIFSIILQVSGCYRRTPLSAHKKAENRNFDPGRCVTTLGSR